MICLLRYYVDYVAVWIMMSCKLRYCVDMLLRKLRYRVDMRLRKLR